MGKEPKESRKVMLTFENPDEHGWDYGSIIERLNKLKADYWCLSTEIGSETETKHIHCAFFRSSAFTVSAISNAFPNVHRDFCKGSMKEIRDYIKKSGEKWEKSEKSETSIAGTFMEDGEMPIESKFDHIKVEGAGVSEQVKNLIEMGLTTAEILNAKPSLVLQANKISVARDILNSAKCMNSTRKVSVDYIFGTSGSGKTSGVYAEHDYKDVCRITSYKGDRILFDGYSGQPVLVFEEFHSQVPIADMLSYLDIYPLMLPARYSDKPAAYTKVYLLSNISLAEQYKEVQRRDHKTWEALLRRIDHVYEQLSPGVRQEHLKLEY